MANTYTIYIPFILKKTIYRDTKKVELEELPRFTPRTSFLQTLFSSATEGAELLFLVIIPAVAVVFTIIGALDYFGIWRFIESGLTAFPSINLHRTINRYIINIGQPNISYGTTCKCG